MTWVAVALLVAACAAAASYWGAGVILYPPNKAPVESFPELYGLAYEKVSFKTRDGLTLRGWFIPSGTGSDLTLLMCHGWGDSKGYLLDRTYFLNKASGFNLLYFDNRSHGESEGRITTIGYLETMDFDAAVDFLRERKPQALKRLGVFGMSMGAAVAILSMPRHPEIKAAVLESPFPDYRNVVRRWAWINMRVPYVPLVWLTIQMLRWRVGTAEVDAASPIRSVAGIAPRPLFLIAAAEDLLMPPEDVRSLFDRAGEPKQLWVVPGAGHTECHAAAQAEYEERLTSFFRRNL
ncbi:MAG: alpha/beta fold hydrolase [Elusimicrobia bacterium]|nr:alpha/beta fold hydrolase [Elusimicrobiota bacterium]